MSGIMKIIKKIGAFISIITLIFLPLSSLAFVFVPVESATINHNITSSAFPNSSGSAGGTFCATSSFNLETLSVALMKNGTPAGEVYLTLYQHNSNSTSTPLSGSNLATSTSITSNDISYAAVGGAVSSSGLEYGVFEFSPAVSITNGNCYFVMVNATLDTSASNALAVVRYLTGASDDPVGFSARVGTNGSFSQTSLSNMVMYVGGSIPNESLANRTQVVLVNSPKNGASIETFTGDITFDLDYYINLATDYTKYHTAGIQIFNNKDFSQTGIIGTTSAVSLVPSGYRNYTFSTNLEAGTGVAYSWQFVLYGNTETFYSDTYTFYFYDSNFCYGSYDCGQYSEQYFNFVSSSTATSSGGIFNFLYPVQGLLMSKFPFSIFKQLKDAWDIAGSISTATTSASITVDLVNVSTSTPAWVADTFTDVELFSTSTISRYFPPAILGIMRAVGIGVVWLGTGMYLYRSAYRGLFRDIT